MAHSPSRHGRVLFTLLVLTAGVYSTALAFSPAAHNAEFEIKLPEFMPADDDAAIAAAKLDVTSTLNARYGGQWKIHAYNLHTGTPHYVYGGSPKVAPRVDSETELELLARQVMQDNPEVFQANPDELRLTAAPHALGKWVAHFQQTYQGLDVWQGKTLVSFTDDGRLALMGSDYHGDIDISSTPGLSEADAIDIATGAVPFDSLTDKVEGHVDLLILPYPISRTEVEHHLVYRVRVSTTDPLGIWVTHLDAQTGQILWRYNDVHFAFGGDTASEVQQDTYCNGISTQAMPYLRLMVDGSTQLITDAQGNWSLEGSGGPLAVTADLYGPYVNLNNYAGDEASFSGMVEDGVPLQVRFDDSNAQHDERDVFDAVNDIHDFFQAFAPGFSYTQARINANVSRTDNICPGNAWWNGTINFCAEAGSNANTGEIQGVVIHEFGHGVQDAILGWQGDQGLGEGNSDILANLMTLDSRMGPGFVLGHCDSGLRDADNSLIYPDNVIGAGIHDAGRVIAGFNWDAMVLMQAAYGVEAAQHTAASNWHYGRMLLHPTTQPDQVFATFFADDRDGNLDNGTPNHVYYCQAAANHGFDCPEITLGVQFVHVPVQDTVDTVTPFTVSASITSTEADLDPATAKLIYRYQGGPWQELTMANMGGDEYEASIPPVSFGEIEYYLIAEDIDGNLGRLPWLAPNTSFSFLIAWLIDTVEATGDWVVGDDSDIATTGIWERVDPVGTIAQPEDDHTLDGTDCWITGQHPGGHESSNDVDYGWTTLYSPIYDLSGFNEVSIRYWKWFSNDQGPNPGEDYWEVKISNDGGATWTRVEYTRTSTDGWKSVTFDLAEFFETPGQVQLRFIAKDILSSSLVEAGIDDLVIAAFTPALGVDDGDLAVRFVTELNQNVPNPFNPLTEISFSLQRAGAVDLRIYDVRGRLVSTLAQGTLSAGPHQVIWNGTHQDGRPVASGTYFYKLEADGQTLSKQMLLIK